MIWPSEQFAFCPGFNYAVESKDKADSDNGNGSYTTDSQISNETHEVFFRTASNLM